MASATECACGFCRIAAIARSITADASGFGAVLFLAFSPEAAMPVQPREVSGENVTVLEKKPENGGWSAELRRAPGRFQAPGQLVAQALDRDADLLE